MYFFFGIAILLTLVGYIYATKKRVLSVVDASKITPVDPSWTWEKQKPLKLRPFVNKKNFNVQMGIKNIASTPEDWLLIEDTYADTVRLRKEIARLHNTVLLEESHDNTIRAVKEMYEIMVGYYLSRYPQYFKLEQNKVINLITGDLFPRKSLSESPRQLMTHILGLIEEDFLLLLKDEEDGEYILRASITGFPAGFDPSANMNRTVSQIHTPVPQYKPRLKSPMANFFKKLNPKDLWVRTNWSVQTHNNLFAIDGNHSRDGDDVKPLTADDVDFDNGCFLRVERQCFLRLPESNANLMTVRTYLTPIKEVKAEGHALELIRGIDSLPPEIGFYKKRGEWGEAVKEYLRE